VYESTHTLLDKLLGLIFGILMLLVVLLAFSFLLPVTKTSASVVDTGTFSGGIMNSYDGSNAVTNGMFAGINELTGTIDSTGLAVSSGRQSVATAVSRSGRFVAQGMHTGVSNVGHGLNRSATFMVRAVSSSIIFINYVPRTTLSFVTNTAIVSAVIQPAKNMPIPTIDSVLPATIATHAALPATITASQIASQTDSAAAWPIHGEITTLFGVPHWPYQPTHTGIDISDGRPSGTTPIKPFKPGRVIATVHSNSGLGNHITVDHGEGVTSVYGHLASISVQLGQAVDKRTVLGFEGSTGDSTGTHLHFEIRLNGQATDPLQFINGLP